MSQSGGIGRRAGFKIPCLYWRVGSIPTSGTFKNGLSLAGKAVFSCCLGKLLKCAFDPDCYRIGPD